MMAIPGLIEGHRQGKRITSGGHVMRFWLFWFSTLIIFEPTLYKNTGTWNIEEWAKQAYS